MLTVRSLDDHITRFLFLPLSWYALALELTTVPLIFVIVSSFEVDVVITFGGTPFILSKTSRECLVACYFSMTFLRISKHRWTDGIQYDLYLFDSLNLYLFD